MNVFALIKEILGKRRNNPFQQFDRYSDIQLWLREQWAGLFRELLNRTSSHTQIASLASQVAVLTEINRTLKVYLEQVVTKVAPEDAKALILEQDERLKEVEIERAFEQNDLARLLRMFGLVNAQVRQLLRESSSAAEFGRRSAELFPESTERAHWEETAAKFTDAIARHCNELRLVLGLPPWKSSTVLPTRRGKMVRKRKAE